MSVKGIASHKCPLKTGLAVLNRDITDLLIGLIDFDLSLGPLSLKLHTAINLEFVLVKPFIPVKYKCVHVIVDPRTKLAKRLRNCTTTFEICRPILLLKTINC